MGYAQGLLMSKVRGEKTGLQKKATKKSLWGSIGRTLGGLGVMALTGGAVNPLTLGFLTGGASFLGGAIGAKAAGGKLTGGRFFQSDRAELQKELGAFGAQNITSSLKSGITAGIGQKLKLMKSGTDAAKLSEGFGMDFKGSMVGKGLAKRTAAKELSTMRGWQGQYEAEQLGKIKEMPFKLSIDSGGARGITPQHAERYKESFEKGLISKEKYSDLIKNPKAWAQQDIPEFGGEFKDIGKYGVDSNLSQQQDPKYLHQSLWSQFKKSSPFGYSATPENWREASKNLGR